MRIVITEEQLRNIADNDDAIIKKKLNVLYRAFKKGKMRIHYYIYDRMVPTDNRSVETDVEYELPDLHRIVVYDSKRQELRKWNWGNYVNDSPHTIYINDIKIKSDKASHPEDFRQIKFTVKDKLNNKFKQMGNADLVISPSSNDVEFESDFVQGDTLKLTLGQPIEHEKFGKGTVVSLENIGDRKVATIKFSGVGTKKIILNLAKMRTWG